MKWLTLAALVAVGSTAVAATQQSKIARNEALETAMRFASAITADPKDMSGAQADVVAEYVSLGNLDRAIELADSVTLWRRGVVYADIANALAQAGRKDDAQRMLQKAIEFRSGVEGWQGPRIDAHVAQVYATLGETEKAREMSRRLAESDRQYAGRDIAAEASGLAAQGEFDQALSHVSKRETKDPDIQEAWWSTASYIGLARQATAPREKRLLALEKARRSAAGIDGWKQAEALGSIADTYRELEVKERAEEALGAAQSLIAALPDGEAAKPALLANLSRGFSKLGDKERAAQLLTRAEPLVASSMDLARAAVYANIGNSWQQLGRPADALRLYDQALDAAEGLVNARPRALSIVQVCRSLGRSGLELTPALRARLDRIFTGLKAPW
ncbi:MAG: tetratricopeptide repeat protein [Acidobacteriota bacterium]